MKEENNKFILTSLDGENSKAIAEVLGSKTCKKIIDYLADVKEASEQDLASALSMPINTLEYNLNKLIRSGLVEKTSNFFWSVKGRKISMFKLARKHIIISPNKKFSLGSLKNILPLILSFGFIGLIVKYLFYNSSFENPEVVPTLAKSVSMDEGAALTAGNYPDISFMDKILVLPYWVWFLIGALMGIALLFILIKLKGGKHGKIS